MEVTRFTINTPGLDTTGSELAEIRAAFQQMSLEVSQFRQEVRQRSPSPYSALAHRRSSSRLSKASHILDNCLLFPDMPKIVGVTTTSDSEQPLASVTLFVLSTGWETSRLIACSGKRSRPNLHPSTFHVSDCIAGTRFLVDTGAEVNIVPATAFGRRNRHSTACLKAANSTKIAIGQRSPTLDLRLRRHFQALFWNANVSHPITGVNFLRVSPSYMARSRLIDERIHLSVFGVVFSAQTLQQVFPKPDSSRFAQLLNQLPDLTKSSNLY